MVLEGSRERAPYEKIQYILNGMVDCHGWEAVLEDGAVIGATVSQQCRSCLPAC